jgi:hypothetical protein
MFMDLLKKVAWICIQAAYQAENRTWDLHIVKQER